jgi:hypothetical protein
MGKVSLFNGGSISASSNITIDDSIEFNILVNFKDSIIKETASGIYTPTMKLDVTGEETDSTVISASDKIYTDTSTTSTNYIAFPYEVSAKNLADTVDWTLILEDKTTVNQKNSSVKISGYLTQVYYMYQNNGSSDYADIAKALLNYGATAQTYKEYNSESLANANLSPDNKNITSVTKNDLTQKFSLVRATNNTTGVKFTGACLDMLTKTQVRVYFTLGSDAKTMLNNGNLYISYIPDGSETPVYVKLSENYTGGQGTFKSLDSEYYFETTGIAPANYANALKFEFYTKDSTTGEFVAYTSADTLTYSVYDYFYNKCESESTTGIAKLVSAMYAYSKACSAYIATHSTTTSN